MLPRAIKRLLHQATISDQSYRFMFKRAPADEVVAIDCETTGLKVRTDDIVAIAAIKIDNDGLTSDIHAEADYRAHLVTVMAKRAVDAALS